jgi:hypothetical protein
MRTPDQLDTIKLRAAWKAVMAWCADENIRPEASCPRTTAVLLQVTSRGFSVNLIDIEDLIAQTRQRFAGSEQQIRSLSEAGMVVYVVQDVVRNVLKVTNSSEIEG